MQLRKIQTAKEKERKDRNRSVAIGIILVFVMILSTAGYAIRQGREEESLKYKGFTFMRDERGWLLQEPFTLLTRFNPKEVEGIGCSCRMGIDDFANQEVYFVAFSSDERTAAGEILGNLPIFRAQQACLEGDDNRTGCAELPLKNCFDNRIISIKVIKEENETFTPRAYQQNRCLFIEANPSNITRAADRALFSIYGII